VLQCCSAGRMCAAWHACDHIYVCHMGASGGKPLPQLPLVMCWMNHI
jgi:hypothetical protein